MKKLALTPLLALFAYISWGQSPTAPALGFNVFLKNDFSTYNSETEGPIAMGGNLNLNQNSYVITEHRNAYLDSGKYISLIVAGTVNFNGGALQINNDGYAKIGSGSNLQVHYVDNNNANSPIRITPTGAPYWQYPNISFSANRTNVAGTSSYTVGTTVNPVIDGTTVDFTTAFNTMKTTATNIGACANNADLREADQTPIPYPYTSLPGNGQVKIQLNTGVNVLNLTGSQMNNITNFTFNNQPDANHVLIINVNAPGSFTWNAWTNGGFGGLTECQYILYNFYNTTALTISGWGAIEGTVFAPFADITKTQYSNVEGQVIAQSYSSVGGENHYAVFQPSYTGCNAGCTTPTPASYTISSGTAYQGQTNVVYKVPTINGTTYNWTYSGTGATINGTGDSISVTFSTTATSGSLSVTATNGSCSTSTALTLPITVKPYITWLCTNNNDWNNGSNWDAGFAPYGTISVLIPNSASCNPSITTGTPSCNNIKVENNRTVNVACSLALNIKGNLTLNGKIDGCGEVALSGTSKQTIYGNGTVSNFNLNNANGAEINNGDSLHITTFYKPTNGTLVTNNALELLSDANHTATIGTGNGCSYISGKVIVNKYIPGGRRAFRFFGHPFQNAIGLDQLTPYIDITGQGGSANGFTNTFTNNPSAYWYNTLTGNGSSVDDTSGWIPFTHTNGQGANAWNAMQGIRVLIRGAKGEGLDNCCNYTPSPVTIKMTGDINQCNETFVAQTNANMGYNFVGNPYASNVDMSLVTIGSSINPNFSVWDPNQGDYGAYVTQPFAYSYVLPAYSAFIIRSAASTNNTVAFTEASKVNATPASLFKTTSGFGNDVVQLRLTSDNNTKSWDRLLLFFDNQASDNNDSKDGLKMSNPSLDFYTFSADNQKQAVDVRPLSQQTIQLGLATSVEQTYAISVEDLNVPAGAILYLHDKYLNVSQPMTQNMVYSFTVTSDANSQGDNRFEINIQPGATSISNINAQSALSVFPNPAKDRITLKYNMDIKTDAAIRIVDMMGREVYRNVMSASHNGTLTIPVAALANGAYIVTVQSGNTKAVQHFIKH